MGWNKKKDRAYIAHLVPTTRHSDRNLLLIIIFNQYLINMLGCVPELVLGLTSIPLGCHILSLKLLHCPEHPNVLGFWKQSWILVLRWGIIRQDQGSRKKSCLKPWRAFAIVSVRAQNTGLDGIAAWLRISQFPLFQYQILLPDYRCSRWCNL